MRGTECGLNRDKTLTSYVKKKEKKEEEATLKSWQPKQQQEAIKLSLIV